MTSNTRPADLDRSIQFILANPDSSRKVVQHAYRIREKLIDLVLAGMIMEALVLPLHLAFFLLDLQFSDGRNPS